MCWRRPLRRLSTSPSVLLYLKIQMYLQGRSAPRTGQSAGLVSGVGVGSLAASPMGSGLSSFSSKGCTILTLLLGSLYGLFNSSNLRLRQTELS
jgi:hypothetical protein